MREYEHSQVFTWLFMATPKGAEWTGKPVTLHVEADTEEVARAKFSESWNLTFAAKIHTESTLNTCFADVSTGTLWSIYGSKITDCPETMACLNFYESAPGGNHG